jgi:hypothetical protein
LRLGSFGLVQVEGHHACCLDRSLGLHVLVSSPLRHKVQVCQAFLLGGNARVEIM